MLIKHRHHYVWQKYLRPWETDNELWCLRNRKIFKTGSIVVGVERDFYETHQLSDVDIEFLKRVIGRESNKEFQTLLNRWIDFFTLPQRSEAKLKASGRLNPETAKKLSARKIQMEEDLHERIEKLGANGLASLVNRDTQFLCNSEKKYDFIYYLCTQYLRTKKIETRFVAASENSPFTNGVSSTSVINAFRHIMSMRMALDLTTPALEYTVQLVINATDQDFITSDQPVINLNCPFPDDNRMPTRTHFYYPVSPNTAIYVLNDENRMNATCTITNKDIVMQHNQSIIDASHEQIYAAKKCDLDGIQ